LQILTIHKAKGLEWDRVILPGLDAGTRPSDPPLLRWQEVGQGEVLLAVPPARGADRDAVYSYLGRLDQKKEENERARLLYVAATRAKHELHIIGCARRDAPPAHSPVKRPYESSLLRLIWDEVRGEFERAAIAKPGAPRALNNQAPGARLIRRVTPAWQAPIVPAVPSTVKQAANTVWDDARIDDSLRHAGTVVHAYLQRIAREGIAGWNQPRIREQQAGFRAMLSDLGVSASELDRAAARVETALIECLANERGRWALGPHEAAQCEYAITGMVEGEARRVILDRIFLEDGVRWIVDYKTSWCEPEQREMFVKREVSQYRGQLERYARILSQAEERPVKLALYFPMMNEWHEWDAPPLVRKQASLFD
ncbi:MAG: 3'-5' exonuclease, partial [Candidatus Acidiferrales bacterium]